MKGVAFTEFVELVEEKFGLDVIDQIFQEADLPSGGVYTSVGTYDHTEILTLVSLLSERTGLPVSDLVKAFGEHLFAKLALGSPHFLQGVESATDFMAIVEDTIHVEVRKLYPDAELPTLEFHQLGPGDIELRYESARPFADLAEGLIRGCAKHFGEEFELTRSDDDDAPGRTASFHYVLNTTPEPCQVLTR